MNLLSLFGLFLFDAVGVLKHCVLTRGFVRASDKAAQESRLTDCFFARYNALKTDVNARIRRVTCGDYGWL